MDAPVRAFVAFELPGPMKSCIGALIGSLKRAAPGVRWLDPDTVHLTLRFLGPSSPWTLGRLETRLRAAAAACPPSDARIAGLGCFPERGAPRVVWLGIALPEPILALQAACEAAAVDIGFSPEERPFRPHLTLGRWRDRARRPELPAVDLGPVHLDAVTIFKSDLQRTGAVHTALVTLPLGGARR